MSRRKAPLATAALLRVKATRARQNADNKAVADGEMPGACPYDKIVLSGKLTYAEAKTRHELLYVSEQKIKQASLETEAAALALEVKRLEVEREKGKLVTVEYCADRQHKLLTCMLDLVKMVASEATAHIPNQERAAVVTSISSKYNAALTCISDMLRENKDLSDIVAAMQHSFREGGV